MQTLTALVLTAVLGWVPQAVRDRATVPETAGTAIVAGRVTVDVNGSPQPVRRARVTIEGGGLPASQKTDTDTQGLFRFEKLPAGNYRIRAEKAGFVPQVRDSHRVFETPAEFMVAAGSTTTRNLPMVRGAAIDGRILKDTGDPAINVVVSAMRFSYDANGRRATAVRQGRTDDRGRFRVHSLPAGEYYLEAATDPLDVARLTVPIAGRPLTMLGRAFYPGVPRLEGAQSIPVATGQEVTGLEFTVPTVPASALRVTLLDSAGAPAKSPLVRVQRVGGVTGEVRGFVNPGNGELAFPSVPAGEFWVTGSVRPSPTADAEYAVTRLTVSGEELAPVVLTTGKGAAVNGRVEVEGGAAPLPSALKVVAYETEFDLPPLPAAPADAPPGAVAADGSFAFNSLFGPRLLRVPQLPSGWMLKSVTLDGVDVSDTAVDFRGGAAPRAVRIVIAARTGVVSGVARNEAGQPVGRARVVAFSADDRTWGWQSRTVRSAESDAEGRYIIDGLLDGKYHLVAVPFLDEGAWMDTTILRRLQPMASALSVSDASKQTVNLVVK